MWRARVCFGNYLKLGNIRTAASLSGNGNGLYGFDQLKTPKGFQQFVDDAIDRSTELVAQISRLPSPKEIIRAMDEISDTVCSVVDSAELCRNTHPDRDFQQEADKASMRINEYLHHLNTNHTLYKAVIKAEENCNLLTDEAKRAAQFLRSDFEKGGIHLCKDKLNRVNQLNIEVAYLCREFNENIAKDPGFIDVFPTSRVPKQLHHILNPIYRSTSSSSRASSRLRNNLNEKGYRITTDQSILSSILQQASDAEVRELAYVQGNSVPHANLAVLDKIIAARHDISQIMGYKSYAELVVQPNMASSPDVVASFLSDMNEMVKQRAVEEFGIILKFKRETERDASLDLEPWDESYYTTMMKCSAFNVDSHVVSSYFPLSQCIEGLKVILESLFGATFRNIPLAPGESWHPDVVKMSLQHPEEGDMGYLYLDLYSRPGKYPGCAHFAIKGGRRVSETDYQLPVVALVCNFPNSHNSVPRLNHGEVETLFHEFGHAIHSLLSRTDYQHFSGTRTVLDLAETPSNLFEYYAWDYRVLKTFAKHHSTGEIIPEKLVRSMQGAKNMFVATELQRQIFYAAMDQKLFGEQSNPPGDTITEVAELKREYTCWKHVEGTHWHTRFTHLLNYGAGYYSYLYAKCFAATIWDKVCSEDPLSLTTGTILRTKFLQHGGAKDPPGLLVDLVGSGIIKHRNGGIVPDVTSLCNEMSIKF